MALRLNGVIETALYVDDLARACGFYEDVLLLSAMSRDTRFCAYDVGGRSVLLLFKRGSTLDTVKLPGGTIPPHDGNGPIHLGLSVDREGLREWEAHLARHGVAVEGRTEWPRGGSSIYFRDPDRHLLELVTPGVWPIH